MSDKEKDAKLKALQLTLDKMEKSYGKGTVMRLGDKPVENVEAIPTGSLGLDIALGIGGYPRGRVIEIYGPESSGKTTLAIHAIAQAQRQGGIAAFIDAEHAFDQVYAANLGVNIENIEQQSRPDSSRLFHIVVAVTNIIELNNVLDKLNNLPHVISAGRL